MFVLFGEMMYSHPVSVTFLLYNLSLPVICCPQMIVFFINLLLPNGPDSCDQMHFIPQFLFFINLHLSHIPVLQFLISLNSLQCRSDPDSPHNLNSNLIILQCPSIPNSHFSPLISLFADSSHPLIPPFSSSLCSLNLTGFPNTRFSTVPVL